MVHEQADGHHTVSGTTPPVRARRISGVTEKGEEETRHNVTETGTAQNGAEAEQNSGSVHLERRIVHLHDLDDDIELERRYEPDQAPTHAGNKDLQYQARRREIASISTSQKVGEPIPRIAYTDEEKNTWRIVFEQCKQLHPDHMCHQFNENFSNLIESGLYKPDDIPQLGDVSEYLQAKTGFRLRPVGGLTSARSFLSSLAFRVFQCTQYVRHASKPLHSVEPDVIHELIGHVTMFADPQFADFSQSIGMAALVASDDDIEKLAKLYWFTVEFGLCRQDGQVRAYGSALGSSFGEMQRALQATHLHHEFDLDTVITTDRSETDYQPKYFLIQSFEQMKDTVRSFAKTLHGGKVAFTQTGDSVEIIMEKLTEQQEQFSPQN